jgi:hypothetical protein
MALSRNVFILIIVLLVALIVAYLLYQNSNKNTILSVNNKKNGVNNKNKVRFKDKVQVRHYTPSEQSTSFDIDHVISRQLDQSDFNSDSEGFTPSLSQLGSEESDTDGLTDSEKEIVWGNAAEDTETEQTGTWDQAFDKPIVTKDEKKKHADKLKRSYNRYQKSQGDSLRYRTSSDSSIKPDVGDNPFTNPELFKGKSLAEIYDSKTSSSKSSKPSKEVKPSDYDSADGCLIESVFTDFKQ